MQVVVIGEDTPTETLLHTIEVLSEAASHLSDQDERWHRYHRMIGEAQDVLSARAVSEDARDHPSR